MDRTTIRRRIERLTELPVHSHVLGAALTAFQRGRFDAVGLARLVFLDPGIAALILRAAYGERLQSTTRFPQPEEAIATIGRTRLQALLLRLAMPTAFDQPAALGPRLDMLWRDALWVAHGARLIAERLGEPEPHEAYVTGLLHDIGRLAGFTLTAEWDRDAGQSDTDFEYDFDHTLAGKWLAECWRLPGRLAEVAWLHHHPLELLDATRYPIRLFEAVALADSLRPRPSQAAASEPFDRSTQALLARLHWTEHEGEEVRKGTDQAVRQAIASVEPPEEDAHDGLRDLVRDMVVEAIEHQGQNDVVVSDAHRQAQRFRAIQRMLGRLLPGQSLSEMLEAFAQTAREDLGIAPGVCCVLDHSGGTLLICSWQTPEERGRRSTVDLHTGERDKASGPPGQITQALQTLGLAGGAAGWAGATLNEVIRWQGLVAAPMLAGGQCWGQLLFDAAACDFDLTEEAFDELMAFTAACGLAVVRRQAEEKLETQAEELVTGIRSNRSLSEEAREITRKSRIGEYAAGAVQAMNAPLNLATAQLQWFANKTVDARDREVLDAIVRHTAAARRAAKDLFFLVRPNTPRPAPCLVNYVLHQIAENWRPALAEKGIQLAERYADGLPRVQMDRRQMEHALSSLMGFSMESMAESGGTLTLQTWASPDRKTVSVHVADTGPGATSEEVAELFEPIAMIRNQPRSTGLALTVARDIIVRHEGRLEVDSDPNAGTAFTINLPAAAMRPEPPEEPTSQTGPATVHMPTILVGDGDGRVRQTLDGALTEQGYRVITASDGAQLLRILDESPVDLVLLDMQMPVVDGHAVLDVVRRRNLPTPVIAMTSANDPVGRTESVQRGARVCLQKPFQLRQLFDELEEALAAMHVSG